MKRQQSATIPPLPKVRADVTLAGKWTEKEDGRRVLMPITDNDTLVFANDDNLRHLSPAGTIFLDGTFKSCPPQYAQLYSIHGLLDGHVVPLVYVLLANKTRTMYFNMFTVIRNAMSKLGLVLNPDNIVGDFELSFIDVVKQHFTRSRHIGCFFITVNRCGVGFRNWVCR